MAAIRTDKQFETAHAMLFELQGYDPAQAERLRVWLEAHEQAHTLTVERASKLIGGLVDVLKKHRPTVVVPGGRYAIKGQDGAIHFYEVQVPKNGQGRTRVLVQAGPDRHLLERGPAAGVLREIGKDAKAAAILYGQELGVCGRCGSELTSGWRKRGIGPVCATKF